MKKKVLALVLSVVMCFAVTACGDKETSASNEPKSEAASEEVSSEAPESVPEVSSEAAESEEEPSSEEAVSTEEANTEEAAGNADLEIKVEIPSEDAIAEQLKVTLGEDTNITIEEYEVYKVGDYDALRFTASYMMEDLEYTQTQCMVLADGKLGLAAFTQEKGGAWTDTFNACIESITME